MPAGTQEQQRWTKVESGDALGRVSTPSALFIEPPLINRTPPPSDPLRDPHTRSRLAREYCKTPLNEPSWAAAFGLILGKLRAAVCRERAASVLTSLILVNRVSPTAASARRPFAPPPAEPLGGAPPSRPHMPRIVSDRVRSLLGPCSLFRNPHAQSTGPESFLLTSSLCSFHWWSCAKGSQPDKDRPLR